MNMQITLFFFFFYPHEPRAVFVLCAAVCRLSFISASQTLLLTHPDCHLASFSRVTLDTPMNRKFMPDADFSSWTPLEYIAE